MTLTSLDAGYPYWRNQTGPPNTAGVLFDTIALNPGITDQAYSVSVDLVQPAPINMSDATQPLQLGDEDIAHIINYALNYLMLKTGGTEFKSTFDNYDSFMSAVSQRGKINQA